MSGDPLARIRSSQEGACWWCGGSDMSREHKHKKSQLKRYWVPGGLDLVRPDERIHRIQGPDSQVVKFKKVLCKKCNNARSKPFDEACDEFSDYLDANVARMNRALSIDWQAVFGRSWVDKSRSLGGYYVKNFGCWMADGGFKPPQVFASFLDGGDLHDTQVKMVRTEANSLVNRAFRRAGRSDLDNGFGTGQEGHLLDAEGTRLIGYEGFSYIRDIGASFVWADQAGSGQLFWQKRVVRLRVIRASAQQRKLIRATRRRLRSPQGIEQSVEDS